MAYENCSDRRQGISGKTTDSVRSKHTNSYLDRQPTRDHVTRQLGRITYQQAGARSVQPIINQPDAAVTSPRYRNYSSGPAYFPSVSGES